MYALGRALSVPWRLLKALGRLLASPVRWLRGGWRGVVRFFTEEPEDTPLAETFVETVQSRDSFFDTIAAFSEHLTALRHHLFRSLIAVALAAMVAFWQIENIMAVLAAPLAPGAQEAYLQLFSQPPAASLGHFLEIGRASISVLTTREPTEGIGTVMRVSLLAALVLAMPWIVTELYLFIAPGLFPKSRVRLLLVIPLASALFAIGVAFTYFVMLPVAVPFLNEFGGFSTAWTPSSYFNLITNLMFWVGVAFQMPLIIYALAAVGLLRSQQLLAQWRLAVVVISIVAAAITPTTDPINMGLVMLPMILLYFISIVGAWFAERGLRRQAEAR